MSEKHEVQVDTKNEHLENGLMQIDDQYREIEKNLVKKLDRRLISLMFMMFFFASTDRGTIGQALIMNRTAKMDLSSVAHLTPNQVSLGVSLFYAGYVIFEVPSNLAMLKLNPTKWLARIMITWGIVSACMAVINGVESYYILRCLLGIMEAGLFPGMAYLMTKFYRKREMATRIGIYYFAAPFAAVTGNLVSAGLQTAVVGGVNSLSMYPWQALFLIFGVLTVVAGGIVYVFLPQDLESCKFLTPEELAIGQDRLRRETHVPEGSHFTWANIVHELKDYRVYLFSFLYLAVVTVATTLQAYGAVVVFALGGGKFSTIQTSLVAIPISVCIVVSCLFFTILSDRFQSRTLPYCISLVIGIVGFMMMSYTTDVAARYIGVLLWGVGVGPGVPIAMSWLVNSKDGEASTAVSTAIVSSFAQIGNIFATYYLYGTGTSEAPQYRRSNAIQAGIYALAIVCAVILRFDLARQNRIIDRDGQTKSGRIVKYLL